MSINPRKCKIVKERLINFKLLKENYKPDPQLKAVSHMILAKDPDHEEKVHVMEAYLVQHVINFTLVRKTGLSLEKVEWPN